MPYQAKSGKAQNWLPNQVVYGVDCSDADPKNWVPFGSRVQEEAVKTARKVPSPESKGD